MNKLQKGALVTITTSYNEDFGYSYNTDILTYIKEDNENYYFMVKEIEEEIRVKKTYVLSMEPAEIFMREKELKLISFKDCKKIKISNSRLTRDKSYTNEVLFLVSENKTHFQFTTVKKSYFVILRKDDRDITYLNLELQEYIRGSQNPFEKYPQLKNIWFDRKRAISFIERFNNSESSGKIFLIVLDKEVIGITGYYLTGNEQQVGIGCHGVVPSSQKEGYGHSGFILMVELLLQAEKNVAFMQEFVPFDKSDLKIYWENVGFKNIDETAKYYEEMPTVKCFKLIKTLKETEKQ